MKLIHLSDLHLGKRLHQFSLLEDQRHILGEILRVLDDERPDAVVIAGDVYDKPVPPAEAVELLDGFLVELARRGPQVLLISGNHDSPERLAFGARLMAGSGVHVSPAYRGPLPPVALADGHGPVYLYLLPFVKPAHVRRAFPGREMERETDAVRAAVAAMGVDTRARNVLVAHQFVTGAARCDSEELPVGGSDGVELSAFDPFDYVALGHLHGPQRVGRESVRYCGSPLKYSFSEAGQQKSVTVVELGAKGDVEVRTVPLTPLRELVQLRGTYEQLTFRGFYEGKGWQDAYVHITLTDEQDVPDAVGRLRAVYPYLAALTFDNARTRAGELTGGGEPAPGRSPLELLEEFYEKQNGQPMGQEQRAFARAWMERIWEEGEA